ncbi:hypothetical protein [Agromyces indicus]|uniref:Uncharacterized protein n=1 Tax=Agromyces indicus TaxID=758919 RepID=A0ABU1FN56_9MICO|nr:hypothetical protein [Agromyces indicus]MDR5693197.1 hypothetical protein [Agromyces indicus]
MTRPARRTAAATLVLIAGLALVGCTAEPATAPTTTPTPTPAETPVTETTPTPDAAGGEVAAILVRADAVEYLDASGAPVRDTRDAYADPVDAALARLTELLGDPVVETYESRYTEGTGTLHRWDGLAIEEFPAGMVADVPDAPTWGVRLESASAGGIDLLAIDGIRVGDPVPAGLERSACNSAMAETVGTQGVEVDGGSAVVVVRAPVYTDVCE